MKKQMLVKGHTLLFEGAKLGLGYRWSGGGGEGIGGCSCGAKSPELPSKSARQRWHKDHKQAMQLEGR